MKIERVEFGNVEVKVKTESLERATPEEEEEKSDAGNGQPTTPSIPQRSRSSTVYQERAEISGGSLNETKPKYHRKTRSELWKYFDRVLDAPQKCGKCHICGTIVPADNKRHGTKMLEVHFRKCSKAGGVVVTQNRAVRNDMAQRHDNDLKNKPKSYKSTRSKLWTYFERVLDAPQTCGKCHVCGTIVPADNQKHGTKMLELHYRKCTKARGHASTQIQVVAPQGNKAQETAPPGFKVKPNDDDDGDELVEFRGLARIPRRHASLLEEECLENPGLAECEGTSTRWRQFVYETVGELLHFMRTTRQGDMADEEKRARLGQLWDEARGAAGPVRVSGLEASVRSALEAGLPLEHERAAVVALEEEMKRLDGDRDTLRCQLATLTMLMAENERARTSLEAQIQVVKSAGEAFLW